MKKILVTLALVASLAVTARVSSPVRSARAGITLPADLSCVINPDAPCLRYNIALLGNPTSNVTLRNKYKAAFGDACYMTDSPTSSFVCYFKLATDACAAELKVATIFGAVPYQDFGCTRVSNDPMSSVYNDYRLQVGPDSALNIYIPYQKAPRQTPLVTNGATQLAVSGPYRNLPEPTTMGPGHAFNCAVVDNNGTPVEQRLRILEVNSNNNGGAIHSDLAGYTWICGWNGLVAINCTEPLELEDPFDPVSTKPQVHHVVPMKDKRGCSWGTNSNSNAAVISQKLNAYLSNKNPPLHEVLLLNAKPAYVP